MLTVGLLRLDVYISLCSLSLHYRPNQNHTILCIKGLFCRLPPHLQACFPPLPPPPKIKQPTCIKGYHSRPTELDTLSDSSSLPNSATIIPHAPTRRRLKKEKKKKKKRLCILFELFWLFNNFMTWKRKKKKKKKKRQLQMVMVGFDPGTYGLRNSRLTTELPKMNANLQVTKYAFIFNMASRTIRPSTWAIPQFQFWLKKPYQI